MANRTIDSFVCVCVCVQSLGNKLNSSLLKLKKKSIWNQIGFHHHYILSIYLLLHDRRVSNFLRCCVVNVVCILLSSSEVFAIIYSYVCIYLYVMSKISACAFNVRVIGGCHVFSSFPSCVSLQLT